jgi:ferredoxin
MAMKKNPIGKNKRSRKRWITARKWVQFLSIAAVSGLLLWSQRVFYLNNPWSSAEILVNLPLYLDPLAMLVQMLSSRKLIPLGLLALITLVVTVLFGRVWCGWFCPIGTLQDWFSEKGKKARAYPFQNLRALKYILLLVLVTGAAFGNLSLMVLDPLTIYYRSMTTAVLPSLDFLISVFEKAAFQISYLQPVVGTVDSWLRPTVFPLHPDHFRGGIIFGAFLVGILLLNRAAPRFYCRYLCPLGGLLGLLSKISWIRVRIGDSCSGCQSCIPDCPTGAIRSEDEIQAAASECVMCMNCPVSCPSQEISIRPGSISPGWEPYDPGRRQVLVSIGAAALGAGILQSGVQGKSIQPHLLRPPGALDGELLKKCIRCGACSEVCPTNAIQPSLTESGLEGLWTPILIPRIGYCDYACNSCGAVCPVEAIPPLTLEQKRTRVIGKAYIDRDRCIAWSDESDCIVCEEMCPISEKAIHLEKETRISESRETREILKPVVDREMCIGCGLCEYKCPVSGEAAIRVYTSADRLLPQFN